MQKDTQWRLIKSIYPTDYDCNFKGEPTHNCCGKKSIQEGVFIEGYLEISSSTPSSYACRTCQDDSTNSLCIWSQRPPNGWVSAIKPWNVSSLPTKKIVPTNFWRIKGGLHERNHLRAVRTFCHLNRHQWPLCSWCANDRMEPHALTINGRT